MNFGKNRRKRYYINRKVQGKYALLTVTMLLLYTIILLGVIFTPFFMTISSDAPVELRAEAATVVLSLHTYIWPAILFTILLFAILSIFITHKIVGPVFVFERMVKAITGGDLTSRARLREGDDLNELADAMNAMAVAMERMLIHLDKTHGSLSSHAEELKKGMELKGANEELLAQIISRIESDRIEIESILSRYNYSGKSIGSQTGNAL